jgi:hypothetical protein
LGFRTAGSNPDLEFLQHSRDSPESKPCIYDMEIISIVK